MKRHVILSLLFILIMGSCIVPFEFESDSFDRSLVVDGIVTNGQETPFINLSYTSPVNSEDFEVVNNATVAIENSGGQTFDFQLVGAGRYEPVVPIEFIVGETYKLTIDITNVGTYESDFTELMESPEIDSIYGRYAELPSEEINRNEGGIQFFIDSDASGKAQYYRYDWEETIQIRTPYTSLYDYNYQNGIYFLRNEVINTCYETFESQQLILGTTINNDLDRLAEIPIHFVSNRVDKIRSRYSLLVNQYAISQDAYSYYRKLKESNESGGFLFDKQLGSLQGNVRSTTNPNETVLGYFEISGVSQKRAFFSREELDERFGVPDFRYRCRLNELLSVRFDSIQFYMDRNEDYRIILEDVRLPEPTRLLIGEKECTTCDWYADPVKPDFWID